jgi:hypothetical protein
MIRPIFKILALCGLSLPSIPAAASSTACEAINLDQGWTRQQSEDFWFTTQGSRMMPYSWFMALEVADPATHTLFSDRSNMERYGYIGVPASPKNPDGLPIGFVKDPGASGDGYLGLTCAACHTGSLVIAGKRVIVEGGPAMSDFWTFLGDAVAALEAAATVPAKFDAFAKKVLHSDGPPPADLDTLRAGMKARLTNLQTRLSQNTPKTPNGFGRVDAFGHIFTRVLAQDLGKPENATPPYGPAINAPVSYPFVWDTPQHDLVQWNGSAPNVKLLQLGPLSRNIGEVLGVFGELEIVPGRKVPYLPFFTKPTQFASSARLPNLMALENMVKTLWSPAWPKSCLPLADASTLARGAKVYADNCVSCHRILKDPERKDEKREIKAVLLPLPQILTDPTSAMNFTARRAKTGVLEGSLNIVKFEDFGPEATGYEILLATVNGVMLRGIDRRDGVPVNIAGLEVNVVKELREFKKALESAQTPRYKARPLNGVWATAPYLHNGSVPTLWDLLSPSNDRPSVFYLGGREFDAQKVGLVVKEAPGTFRYDTSAQGNWRNGHEFGAALPLGQKKDLLEFLKTL